MTSKGWRLELDTKKSGRRPLSPDKHKTSRNEGCYLTFWPDWLMTSTGWRLELDKPKSGRRPLSGDKHKAAWA
ncbi:hypothetical protein GJU40_18165 [Bacillus lacus]|uniref:Uncharacterized protein n=1 Tax=Metabacillus lacus TaxID=1983721 RepID=A0A7X2J2B9_9BACI|nr:hypothetical protein [Metabacillus lacus]MRX74051.1 hypothetical protein [Metabacillus lacus]